MADYKIVFSEVKARVGVDDVAYSLGYTLNKKAGVGKYFELVLGNPNNPIDTIIVRNTPDKRGQTFFRRNGSKGDVVTLIKENLNSFNVPGGNDEWMKVANVLASFANMPTVDYADNRKSQSQTVLSAPQKFDADRYEIKEMDKNRIPYVLYKRGFTRDCLDAFGENVVLIKDKKNTKFDGYNIGFPYKYPDTDDLAGFEIRGSNGFKSKAAGTDSAHSAWIAQFGDKERVRNVYFFESSFDAMAFYQLNKARISLSPFAVVSMGGSFTAEQLTGVMNRFPNAKGWDCFDNDIAGQNYSSLFVKTIDKTDHTLSLENGVVSLSFNGKTYQSTPEDFCFKDAAKNVGLSYNSGHWKCPDNYKDWNDCLLNKPIVRQIPANKWQRDENLAQRRSSTLKM